MIVDFAWDRHFDKERRAQNVFKGSWKLGLSKEKRRGKILKRKRLG